MKNNESLNSPDLSGVGMTPEEFRLYRDILDAAYPKPKRDIKSGVMQAIREESSAVIIPAKEKKKERWRRDLVKWGSLAASVVIIAAVGIKVLPAFLSTDSIVNDTDTNKAAQDAYSYTTSTAEATAETAMGESTVGGLYKSMHTNSQPDGAAIADEEITTEAAPAEPMTEEEFEIDQPAAETAEVYFTEDYTDAAEDDMKTLSADTAAEEAVVEEMAAAEEEAVIEETVPETGATFFSVSSVESTIIPVISCDHQDVFRDSYHEIPSLLIEEVGEDEYYSWANAVSRDDPCAVNIHSFIENFSISQTAFTMYLSTSDIAYYCDYPVDVLYEWSDSEIESYYADGGRYASMVADYFEYEFKLALVAEIGTTAYTEWLGEVGCSNVRGWSISQMVKDNGIDEAAFTRIYEETAEDFPEEYDGYDIPEYDMAMVYTPNAGTGFALAMSRTGYAADVACRK